MRLKAAVRSGYGLLVGLLLSHAALAGPPTLPNPVLPNPVLPVPNGQPHPLQAYVTGYSYWDNTPRGSVEISHPARHRFAGGSGTFADPVTMAVGHQIIHGVDHLDFPAGTRFYLPRLHKYAVVEDSCGDGPTPQNGPCHSGYKGRVWLDIYVDGAKAGQAASEACMQALTGLQPVVIDPGPALAVVTGPVTEGGCFVFFSSP